MNRTYYRLVRALVRVVCGACFGLRGQGREHIPATGPVVVVANHASYLDPVFLGVKCRRICRFLARDSLEKVPIVGPSIRAFGSVFVDRGAPATAAIGALVELLKANELVGVFPEGTRSPDGAIHPFKRGVLLVVKKSRAAVVPAGIRGSFEVFPRGRRLPRLFRRCAVSFGPPMSADEVLADGGLEELRRRVARLSGLPLAEVAGSAAAAE